MSVLYKGAGLALVTLILGLSIEKREKDVASLLSMAACCCLTVMALTYLMPILDLLWEVNAAGQLQDDILTILLKATGIGLVTEICGGICSDAGNGSLAKVLRILGATLILNLTVPLIETLLRFIQEMLYNI